MKILQLGKFYPIRGGVEKVMYDLMTGLSSRDIKCDMLCAGHDGKGVLLELNRCAKLIAVDSVAKAKATMLSPRMISKLRKIADNYDIIHVHHPDPMACLALLCSGYEGKVVLHWHSDILKQRQLLKFYLPLQRKLIKRADLIVGTSPVYLKESPFLKTVQHKTLCLPIGISELPDTKVEAEIIRRQYQGKRIVFSLGRLVGYKGYEYLIEAANFLGDDYVVLIGGTGPLKTLLQEQIDRLGLQNRVKLLGYLPEEELPKLFHACDLFCLSSVWKTEAFGIVQIEAMSCGKPVVATKIPESGVSWVNAHGVSGLNVEPCNAAEIAEAIKRITENDTIYQKFCEGARNRYMQMFTFERMIDNCLDIYKRLIE